MGSGERKKTSPLSPRPRSAPASPGGDGIIGNRTLLRFHVVFDFTGGKFYLKANRRFREPFEKK